MRLDKFLKVSRVIKRRTVAAEACDRQRVSVNGQVAKPGKDLKAGDLVEVRFGAGGNGAQGRRRRDVRDTGGYAP